MNLLITGAASGIGRATARRMAQRMHVIIADRDGAGACALAAELREQGRQACALQADVARSDSVREMFGRIAQEIGPVHALFHNAGIYLNKPVEAISEQEWDAMMATHVKGAYLCAQAVLPQMCERRTGVIVNMASDYAVAAIAGGAAYAAAKTAVYSLTKSLALEFAPYGIRVNALGPGPIATPMLREGRSDSEWESFKAARQQRVPMGRLGRPEEVAAVVDFLLSERSAYLTGQIIHPNGGQLSW